MTFKILGHNCKIATWYEFHGVLKVSCSNILCCGFVLVRVDYFQEMPKHDILMATVYITQRFLRKVILKIVVDHAEL